MSKDREPGFLTSKLFLLHLYDIPGDKSGDKSENQRVDRRDPVDRYPERAHQKHRDRLRRRRPD